MLLSRLSEQLALHPAQRLVVGYSGGQDSQVLLSALLLLKQQQSLPPICAIHVNHQLQEAAAGFQRHCQHFCEQHGIALNVELVRIQAGGNVEEKARSARLQAFAKHLQPGDLLLLAQHQQDQSETLLYRLMRGAGVQGLSSIWAHKHLGGIEILRPLLCVPKKEIAAFAQQQQLSFVEDPSNQDEGFDRNFIRRQILPKLQERWPKVADSLQQVVSHQQEAQSLLDELAEQDLSACYSTGSIDCLMLPASLDCHSLLQLSPLRKKNALRSYFKMHKLRLSQMHWQRLMALLAKKHGKGQLAIGNKHTLLYYANSLYILKNTALTAACAPESVWQAEQPLLQKGVGTWQLSQPLAKTFEVCLRQGGETLLLNGQRQKVKKLLQQARVPFFQRAWLPLFYYQGELFAVGNVLQSDDASDILEQASITFNAEGL